MTDCRYMADAPHFN